MQTGEIAQYRKALRNMPEQAGFPFNIQWPTRPGEKLEEAYPVMYPSSADDESSLDE